VDEARRASASAAVQHHPPGMRVALITRGQAGRVQAAVTVAVAVVIALASGYIGYFVRGREFRREHRLAVYGEFVAAFLELAHVGAGGLSLYLSLGTSLYSNDHEGERNDLYARWATAFGSFENTAARVRLVASKQAREACERIEDFVQQNILAVPPFMPGEPDPATWGDAAKVGPRRVDDEATRLAREFADSASRDVVPSREH
jgi:hypothetical protein